MRDVLASRIPGARVEVPCSAGFADIVTPAEVIEVKRAPLWKAALGQVLAYSPDFPGRKPRVHLFGPGLEHFRLAAVTCERFGVRVTASGPGGEDIDVLGGGRPVSQEADDGRVADVAERVDRDHVGLRGPGDPGGVERAGQ